jgi:phage-related baseplate assembly protein
VEDAELEFSYTLTPEGDARRAEVRDAVLQAMADYRAWQEGALGRDLTPSRLYAAVQSVPGVASVTVVSPPSAPVPPDALVRLTFIAARSGGVQA